MPYLEIAIGLVLLLAGGEFLVRGSVAVAKRMGVSTLMIGLTLVGFGTSAPELVTSIQAALAGSPGIAVGNVVGSNIANILLILGVAALLLPVPVERKSFQRDGGMLIAVSLAAVGVVMFGHLGQLVGGIFVAALIAYIVWTYFTERESGDDRAEEADHKIDAHAPAPTSLWIGILLAVGGLAAVVYGADLLVNGAIVLALALGVSDAVIGLTLVAVGTSLPELATTVTAALRRQEDVAFGNVVGSNIYNVLAILGITALILPLRVPDEIILFDIWVLLGSALLLVLFVAVSGRVARWHGALFLSLYGLYLAIQALPGLRTGLGIPV